MKNTLRYSMSLVALLLALLAIAGCGSDDPAAPVEDVQVPVYNWGGVGLPGLGALGQKPADTRLYWPQDVVFNPAGKPVVLDWNNHRVIGIDASGNFELLVGRYFGNPSDGPADQADLNHPTHACFLPNGNMILSAWHNSILMELDVSTNWIARWCGTGGRSYNGDDRQRLTAALDLPVMAVVGSDGDIYLGDQANHVIRKVDASGVITTVAGTAPSGTAPALVYHFGWTGDGGPATSATLHFERGQAANPSGRFCFDAAGNMYIADTGNHAVRMVDTNGLITTFAGTGPANGGFAGDGGLATLAKLREPRDVVVDLDGNLVIADTGNHVIRIVNTSTGIIRTLAGVPRPFTATAVSRTTLEGEHGKEATTVHFTAPFGVEVDANNDIWVSDTQNNLIRIIDR